MKLSTATLRESYDFLSGLSPFSEIGMPKSGGVHFVVNRSTMLCGSFEPDPYTITISSHYCKTYSDLLETMAHEMAHLALEKKGIKEHAHHNLKFMQLAAKICKSFGWELRGF